MNLGDILFNTSKPFTPMVGGSTNFHAKAYMRPTFSGTRLQESEKQLFEDDIEVARQKLKKNLEAIEHIDDEFDNDHVDDVYTKYDFSKRSCNVGLPIYSSKREILEKIAKYQSVIIEGSTGCGKSTQIPQMILDDAKAKKKRCNIVVTQPRRIAARSIAERVANERGWDLGSLVGYQIGLDREYVTEDTRIKYCTTGVLLEKLIQKKTLSGLTHIILDEIHERNKDMDFLFIIIRMLMANERTNCKIILMSATINSVMFANYFECYHNGKWRPAPIIEVDKEYLYKVKVFYLDDLDHMEVPNFCWDLPGISEDMYRLAVSLIQNMKAISSDPNAYEPDESSKLSSVLIFLPGIYEIGQMRNYLIEHIQSKGDVAWKIYILHSMISTNEQQSIFQPVENGVQKIILSTNIAESSITVPDVKCVIDFCLMKYLYNDSTKNFTSLEMDWASRNNCRQRAGRAGRIDHGRCYRLVYRRHFERDMRESPIPELRLTPLENAILKAKTFEMESPHVILGQAMEDSKPDIVEIANTVLSLKTLGALQLTYKDEGYSQVDGDLTFLGQVMAHLPIDVRATRLIAFGFCFGVLGECIIMAAGLTAKSIFKIVFDRDLSQYTRRLEWSNGSGSDLFAILNAYRIWTLKYNLKEFGSDPDQQRAERDFCRKHCLDVRSLHECHLLVQELTHRLDNLGLYQVAGLQNIHWTEEEKSIILKVVIAGAFYPNFYSTAPITNPIIERNVYHALNGRDPNNTVYFSGFRKDNIRELYVDTIRNLFVGTVVNKEDIDSVKISFDDSEKVFVTFERLHDHYGVNRNDWDTKQCSIPGKVMTEVYKAIKMRKININNRIGVMKKEKDELMAEKIGLGVKSGATFVMKKNIRDHIENICIPSVIKKEVDGIITHVEHCSKFWFQPKSEKQRVENFKRILNDPNGIIDKCSDFNAVTHEQIIVARDHNDHKLYRARLVAWDYDRFTCDYRHAVVNFIDYGHTQKCDLDDLFVFTSNSELATLPPRCFQCRLANIEANTANVSGGNSWDYSAINFFKDIVFDRLVKAKIYSVVNSIVNVVIFVDDNNLNERLIFEKYGVFCEENYLSLENCLKRQRLQEEFDLGIIDEAAVRMDECGEYYPIANVESIKPVKEMYCSRVVHLKGPMSPLETQIHPMVVNGDQQSITIDPNSVNSVFLRSLQQDLCMKYVVASHISTTDIKSNNNFTIHETTTLPNIRGFGVLMAMIFCPAMDLKRDDWKSRYISVRTGLGFNDEKEQPYYAEHDAVFPLDFLLDESDINMINQIRYSIGTLLLSASNRVAHNDTISVRNKLDMMKRLKDVSLELLTKIRKPIEINHVKHEWKEYDRNEFEKFNDFYGGKSIFPPHGMPRLMPLSEKVKHQLRQHCKDLHNMALFFTQPTMCKLCATQIENVSILRNHLITRLHLAREEDVGFKSPQATTI